MCIYTCLYIYKDKICYLLWQFELFADQRMFPLDGAPSFRKAINGLTCCNAKGGTSCFMGWWTNEQWSGFLQVSIHLLRYPGCSNFALSLRLLRIHDNNFLKFCSPCPTASPASSPQLLPMALTMSWQCASGKLCECPLPLAKSLPTEETGLPDSCFSSAAGFHKACKMPLKCFLQVRACRNTVLQKATSGKICISTYCAASLSGHIFPCSYSFYLLQYCHKCYHVLHFSRVNTKNTPIFPKWCSTDTHFCYSIGRHHRVDSKGTNFFLFLGNTCRFIPCTLFHLSSSTALSSVHLIPAT